MKTIRVVGAVALTAIFCDGTPTECGAATINNATGEFDVVVAQ